jgi:hypothetical protein
MFKALASTNCINQIITFFLRVKAVHSTSPILLFYNYCGNPAHKINECNILSEDIFCDYCGKRDIRKLFVLLSSRNGSKSDYHNKICQHFSLPFDQKPKHLNLPLRLFPPRVIPIRMLRRSTMLIRGRCFKPMPFKFKLYKMNLNH